MKSLMGFVLLLFVAGCASAPTTANFDSAYLKDPDSPAFHVPRQPLVPRALVYKGDNAPIIKHVLLGGAAFRAGLRANDRLLSVNGQSFLTAAEFEKYLRKAPTISQITFLRNGKSFTSTVRLANAKPRLGAGFEPEAVAFVKPSSPLIANMNVGELTAHVNTTVSNDSDEIHLNVILESAYPIPVAHLNMAVSEAGAARPFGRDFSVLDALNGPRILSKTFRKKGPIKGPVLISLNVDKKQFRFEFQ